MTYPECFYRMNVYDDDWSIQCIIEAFEKTPTEFERFCGELFKQMGYQVHLTSPTKDGGYDLLVWNNEMRSIVECKCYPLETKVGRPQLQKLVGANATIHADQIWCVTTSDYTSDAILYAKEVGIRLFNGSDLEHFIRSYFSC